MHLSQFDIGTFLSEYWQKKPVLIRNPWSSWSNPLDPDDLAGLACEDGIESRLIVQAGQSYAAWTVEHGPLAEARFSQLAAQQWTLLVQAVDHHVPDVAALIEPFRFIPDWRIDDVMVSYATDGGGVGPHFDQYDVFLIQGLGKRRWQVGAACDPADDMLPHDDLRLLADFTVTDEWVLEPGDILYVPPRFAHNGVAVGDDCMTYSIGFRAPSRSELIAHYCDDLLSRLQDDDRYSDPAVAPQENPGEISADALAKLQAMIAETMLDRTAFARWFGAYNSTPKYPEADWRPDEPISIIEVRREIANGSPLARNPASRFSFVRHETDGALLFVDGHCFDCAGDTSTLAQLLCASDLITIDPALASSDAVAELLAALINQGSAGFDIEE